ncbi:MAG: YchF/TatD family DNA exonuclease [Chitinivibrionales bacterium]|nr:YchF/TatD family DNA exonuclease [Chitinivibrionales bacterium]
MWIDTHAHLSDLSPTALQQEMASLPRHKVSAVVNAATDLKSAETIIEQCTGYSSLYGTVGISPFDVMTLPENWESRLRTLAGKPSIIGIGEIGIDSTNPRYPSLDRQMPVFEHQLMLAKELSMPAVIHSRGAEKRAVTLCKSLDIQKVIFHCFTGSQDALGMLLDEGYYVSFSGIITFKNQDVKERVVYAPLDRIFIETDTPYLAPVPFRGKRNRPAWVSHVGKKAAALKNISTERLAEALKKNFNGLFSVET